MEDITEILNYITEVVIPTAALFIMGGLASTAVTVLLYSVYDDIKRAKKQKAETTKATGAFRKWEG